MDKGRLNKKIIFCLLASPITLLPFVVGATGLVAAWVFSLGVKITFISFTSCLASVAALTTRIFYGSEGVTRRAMEELERENAEERQESLQELRERLEYDGDPRTENLLDDLIEITKSFSEGNTIASRINATSAFDIASGVERLFDECINLLSRSLVLYETAIKIKERGAKKALLDDRENIVQEVQKSIKELGKILASIQTMEIGDKSDISELTSIREELDQNLKIARQVEINMGSRTTAVKIRT